MSVEYAIFTKNFFWTNNYLKYRQIFWFMIIWPKILNISSHIGFDQSHNYHFNTHTPKMTQNQPFLRIYANSKSILRRRNDVHAPIFVCRTTNMFKTSQNFFHKKIWKTFENIDRGRPPPPKTAFLVGGVLLIFAYSKIHLSMKWFSALAKYTQKWPKMVIFVCTWSR